MPKQDLGELLIVEALGRIDDKLEKLDSRLDDQGKVLVGQAASLDEHVRRTNMLEDRMEQVAKQAKDELPRNIQEEMRISRNRWLLLALKLGATLVALGGGGFGIHHGVMKLIEIWGG